jgi:tol-pal system protein YbgF
LLKQGLSFLNLGNKTSASLILQQVIKNYPNTNQARIARRQVGTRMRCTVQREKGVRKYILLAVAGLSCVAGCAMTADISDVRRDLIYLNEKLDVPGENVRLLKEENAAIRSSIKKNEEALSAVQTRQAEIGDDMTSLRNSIQQLTEVIEALKKNVNRRNEEIKALEEKLDAVSFKTNYLQNFLDIGNIEEFPETRKKGAKQASKKTVKGTMEAAYMTAYGEFTGGRYENARTEFQNFLKQYANTEYSDNAQFWIGECYYSEQNYEKAILEYDKVAKNYPTGDKVPHALLKQGLSFLNLGNKSSASLTLQQLIKDYPNANQARIAREKLREIK